MNVAFASAVLQSGDSYEVTVMIQTYGPFAPAFSQWDTTDSPSSMGLLTPESVVVPCPGELGAAFLASAALHLDRPAFISDERSWSYRDLRNMAYEYAEALIESLGWAPGSCVALQLENSAEYIAAFYGILIAGGVVIPLPAQQTNAWVEQVLKATNSLWIIDRDGLHSCVRDPAADASVLHRDAPAPNVQGLAAIFFTSGSSGTPKGVMLSHANFLANASSIQRSLPIKPTDRTLAVLPFCHAFGNSVMQSHLLCGAALVVAGSTTFPESLVAAMQTHSVTSFSGVPQLHQLIFRGSAMSAATVPSLRYVTVAGGALRSDMVREFAKRIAPAQFFVMYGQTEGTARLSCLPYQDLFDRCGSIGRGIPGVTLQVVDDNGREVIPGEQGEIRASGANIMLGYWNDPDSTDEIIRDGWLYTGDLATVDEDGFIFPQGRKSQLVKIAGYRIHPAEIEAVITRSFPHVEAIVVAFDGYDGLQRLALFAFPLRSKVLPDLQRLRGCCTQQLARFQRPDYIAVLEYAPLTPSLKVDRQKLSQWAAEAVRKRSQPQIADTISG